MSEIIEVLLSQRVRGGWSGPVKVEMTIPQAGEAVRWTAAARNASHIPGPLSTAPGVEKASLPGSGPTFGSGAQARFDHTPIGGWAVLSWSGTMSQIFAVQSAAGIEPN